MEVASLRKIALKSVMEYIHDGLYDNVDYTFDSNLSNEICAEFLRNPCHLTRDLCIQFRKKLNSTKADLYHINPGMHTIGMLSYQNLEFLNFECLEQLEGVYNNKNQKFDIVSLLHFVLNDLSKKTLKYLGIPGKNYEYGWTESIGEMLPNLEHLRISIDPLSSPNFSNLCHSFRNLKVLNCYGCDGQSLKGISSLANLEILFLEDLRIETPQEMLELFECSKLRMLDLSQSENGSKIIENYLKCEKVLEELAFFDCNGTDIDENMVEKLMETHRKLKRIGVLDTILDQATIPGIELLNNSSLQSYVKCMEYYLSIKKESYFPWLLNNLHNSYLVDSNCDGDSLKSVFSIVCRAMREFETHSDVGILGVKCLNIFARDQNLKLLSTTEIVLLVETLINTGTLFICTEVSRDTFEEIWDIIDQENILELPQLNSWSVCLFAAKCLNQFRDFYHYNILERITKRIDPMEIKGLYPKTDFLEPLFVWLIFNSESGNWEKIGTILDIFIKITRRNLESCQRFATILFGKMSFLRIGLILSRTETDSIKPKFLDIFKNLTRFPSSECAEYLKSEVSKLIEFLNENPKRFDWKNGQFVAEILSTVLSYKSINPKEKIWKIADLKLRILLCSRNFEFSENFKSIPILKDFLLNSYRDGLKMWALLAMKRMMEENIEERENFLKFGLFSDVRRVKSNKSQLMKLRLEVLKFKNC